MNKKSLVKAVSIKTGYSVSVSSLVVKATLESILDSLANDESVRIQGFGTFSVRERAARKGVTPITQQAIEIPAKKVIKFKASDTDMEL